MEIIQQICYLFALELGFWGTLVGTVLILILLFKESKPKELFLFFGIVMLGFLLRLKFGMFAPAHESLQYIEIINSYFENFNYHNFFTIENNYHGSFGFMEFFINRILYFFSSFNIYYVYYINLIISVIKGVVLFYIAKVLFNNKIIAFLSLLILMLFPIEIKLAATELQTQLTSFSLLLSIAFFVLYYKKQKLHYLILFLVLSFSVLYGRIDFSVFYILLLIVSSIFLFIKNKTPKEKIIYSSIFLFMLIVLFGGIFKLYYNDIYTDGYVHKTNTILEYRKSFFPNLLLSQQYFGDHDPGHPIIYLKSFFIPLYVYFSLKYSWILFFYKKKRKEYIAAFVFTFMLIFFTGIMSIRSLAHMRLALPAYPLICLLVATVLYKAFSLFRMKKRYIIGIILSIVFLSFFQNWNFLNLVFARQVEQRFLINQIKKIPDNSLLLVLTEKRLNVKSIKEEPIFEPTTNCQHYYYNRLHTMVEGVEFPSYLLAGKNIDIMDICLEYSPLYFDNYEHVYYYRGLDAFYGHSSPTLTRRFETKHELREIDSQDIVNIDLYSSDVHKLKAGDSSYIDRIDGLLNIGFYQIK